MRFSLLISIAVMYGTMGFEIDPGKASVSWIKHKTRLETAALVFADPLWIKRQDDSEGNTVEKEQ
jgi:uncharacterized DUF497 family protein